MPNDESVDPEGIRWTSQRIAQAKALRWYQQQWKKCIPAEQRRLEWLVYALRGRGVPEREVRRAVEGVLERLRPWRMSDAKLGAMLGALYAQRRQLRAHRGARIY
jgi:hypothetical protein